MEMQTKTAFVRQTQVEDVSDREGNRHLYAISKGNCVLAYVYTKYL